MFQTKEKYELSWAVIEKYEKWEDEVPPDTERDPQPGGGLGPLPPLCGLHTCQVHQVRVDWTRRDSHLDCVIDWPWKLFLSYFRSLPLPKLGLNNSCWNAGKETFFFIWLPVSACRSLPFLQSFPLKNPSKNSYRVCLFNSCVEVNHYISLLWLHCKWWLGWKPLCLPLT